MREPSMKSYFLPLVLLTIFGHLVDHSNSIHRRVKDTRDRPCVSLEGYSIVCPARTEAIGVSIRTYIDECHRLKESSTRSQDFRVTCGFFPNYKAKGGMEQEPCDEHFDPNLNNATVCTNGFIVRSTRQKRGGGRSGFISVKFFGLIMPVPSLMTALEARQLGSNTPANCKNEAGGGTEEYESYGKDDEKFGTIRDPAKYDVTEWLALGISGDRKMGDDLVIHCNPFMDENARKCGKGGIAINDTYYKDPIGIAINTYNTYGDGKIPYEAEPKFSVARGSVKNAKVKYVPSTTSTSFGYLECEAEISTYIILQSKSQRETGLEIDMEKLPTANILLTVGPCLVRDCLGDTPDNDLQQVAARTTVMAKHRKKYITKEKVILFERVRSGAKPTTVKNGMTLSFIYCLAGMLTQIISMITN